MTRIIGQVTFLSKSHSCQFQTCPPPIATQMVVDRVSYSTALSFPKPLRFDWLIHITSRLYFPESVPKIDALNLRHCNCRYRVKNHLDTQTRRYLHSANMFRKKLCCSIVPSLPCCLEHSCNMQNSMQ